MHPLAHAANVISLCSYLVRDVLWLRLLSIVASTCTITYLATATTIAWDSIGWSSVFATINIIQCAILIRERQPVHFDSDQTHLYDLVFRALRPRDFLKLWHKSRWLDAAPEQHIVREGEVPEGVMVVCDGEVVVRAQGKEVARLDKGHFVGEMSFITGNAPKADVVVTKGARLRLWPHADLRAFLEKHPDLKATVQVVLGTDLVKKLQPRG